MFDHGCDAVSTVLLVYVILQVFRVGNGLAFFVLSISVMTGFYVANWEEYHTGVL